jgi:predicted NUDIX family NTP pyrophosphohydrolase
MVESAGVLLYRPAAAGWEVLLVHPSGPYNRRAPWSIPKGLPEPDESLEQAARREAYEETSVIAADLTPLGFICYRKSRKRVHCFAGQAPPDCHPRCASWEVDRAEFVSLEEAYRRLHPDQLPFLDRLRGLLAL